MFKIGYRTAKTAIGAAASISIAQFFSLENYVSAGILTILCVQVTKKKSFLYAWERFIACLIGIVFAFVFFEGIAYHPLIIGLVLILFIPITVRLKITTGIASSSVILLQFYIAQQFTLAFLLNELAIMAIGIGVALLTNLYMPSVENDLKKLQVTVEDCYKKIFQEISLYLTEGDHLWDGKEITMAYNALKKAKGLALRNNENHFIRNEDALYYNYFSMREKQFDIIERMLSLVSSLDFTMVHSKIMASFIDELGSSVHSGNTAEIFLVRLETLKNEFREMSLPKNRTEFEIRASLYHLFAELEQYLIIKRNFKESDV
ncbi:aromatic acid exporter family protein [Bacillus sp. Marseille-P3661]|uniref:aromatic acid exporter family protein n=1 Tax=Bacillus sp. Marseille-P3661 TaxID=1936234 RepID=UPI000C82F8C6|nr:aromatic acid exporter family protein [Bacillus sp. Marseille-P3661]